MRTAAALLLLLVPLSASAGSHIRRFSMGGDIDVSSAPHGAVLRTMGGDIRVSRADGRVIAKTMGGGIRIDRLTGSIDAGTMGGDVEVDVLGAGEHRRIEASSVGGSIELALPKNFDAEFEIELEHDDDDPPGKIISDVPLKIQESTRRRWMKKVTVVTATGMSGSGANRIRLHAIGGDITIRTK
jgi:DUF4097 and DUF4098 domain-containing protein YvlB